VRKILTFVFHAGAEIEVARSGLNPRVGTLVNVEAATDSNVPPSICAQLAIVNLLIKSKFYTGIREAFCKGLELRFELPPLVIVLRTCNERNLLQRACLYSEFTDLVSFRS
jgi:hypothetical protein